MKSGLRSLSTTEQQVSSLAWDLLLLWYLIISEYSFLLVAVSCDRRNARWHLTRNCVCDAAVVVRTAMTLRTCPTPPRDPESDCWRRSLHREASTINVEGTAVTGDLENLLRAMCLLFGLIFALNVEYPQHLKNTFDFSHFDINHLNQKYNHSKVFWCSDWMCSRCERDLYSSISSGALL